MTTLSNARIVTASGLIKRGWMRFSRTIDGIGTGDAPVPSIDLDGRLVVPGFIDLHNHGGLGTAFGDDEDGTRDAIAMHRRAGTTTIIASVATAEISVMRARVELLARAADEGEIEGIHLEGPFLAHSHRGAHDPTLLLAPDLRVFKDLVRAGRGHVRVVTIAPELDGAMEIVDAAVASGIVVAIGHTGADDVTAARAFDRGATLVTHLFNGMRGIGHRDPGPVPVALRDDRVTVELITDGHHIHPLVVELVLTAFERARVALITDASFATGLGDGSHEAAGSRIVVRDGEARLADGSSLAGSVLTLERAFRNCLDGGIPLARVVAATSTTPARAIRIDERVGSLSTGMQADLVVWDEGSIHSVYRRGVLVP